MRAETERSEPKKGVHWGVKVWVIFHALAILAWSLPRPSSEIVSGQQKPIGSDHILVFNNKHVLSSPLKYYMLSTGFWQYWDMFAPNPSNWDGYADAEITFQDGSKRVWEYPRMAKLPIVEKYFKERYRKFLERGINQAMFWPDFAQRVALLNYDDPANPPVSVKLRRNERIIQPPGKPQPKDFTRKVYFDYQVDQRRLKRDAGS